MYVHTYYVYIYIYVCTRVDNGLGAKNVTITYTPLLPATEEQGDNHPPKPKQQGTARS